MKTQIITSICIFLMLVSCNNSQTPDKPKPEIPEALEDNKGESYEILSKRGGRGDLVEDLYRELVDKTPELKELENKIENLNKSKNDSFISFDNYNKKNQSFYNSVDNKVEQIKDSVLRDKMKMLIAKSLTKYQSSISGHDNILTSIETKNLALTDLHVILKISRTLPLIDKYQKDNLPTIKSLESVSKQFDETLKYADTLIKK